MNMKWMILVVVVCLALIEVDSFRIFRRPGIFRRGRYWPGRRPIGLGYNRGSAGRSYARGRNYDNQRYDKGAQGSEGGEFHNGGRREFHNIGSHHNKYSKTETSESSGSHNIGGSESFNNGAGYGRDFNNYDKGARSLGNDYQRGQEHTSW